MGAPSSRTGFLARLSIFFSRGSSSMEKLSSGYWISASSGASPAPTRTVRKSSSTGRRSHSRFPSRGICSTRCRSG